MWTLAEFALNGTTLAVIAGVGVAVLGVVYFAVRFWLISTRPVNIREVETPNLDRLNRAALESMQSETDEEPSKGDDAPEALKSIVPPPDSPSRANS